MKGTHSRARLRRASRELVAEELRQLYLALLRVPVPDLYAALPIGSVEER